VSRKDNAVLLEHVDDLGIAAPTNGLDKIEQIITKHVELEQRDMKGLLGMVLTLDEDKLWLTQTRLIERTVEQVGEIGKRLSLSSDSSDYEKLSEQDEPADPTKYQQLIGSLLFIARGTRPDISVANNFLGRRAKEPSIRNWETALKVLAYLYSTKYVGLCLSKPKDLEIEIVVDASRGTTRSIAKMGGQTILWYTRRQDTTSLSISEAEYIAAAKGAKNASWLRQLLHEMEIRPTNRAIPLYTDNMAAQQLSRDVSYRR
jgi:hypothetical protein